jgi:hypothetical protein
VARTGPPVYRGYEGSSIYERRTGVYYAHVINLRESMIPFRFQRVGDFGRALRIAVDAYLADRRLAGIKPEKPVPPTSRERAVANERTLDRRVSALLRKSRRAVRK